MLVRHGGRVKNEIITEMNRFFAQRAVDGIANTIRINGHGEIRPNLLTDDSAMKESLATHPALLWKAQNVRGFRQGEERAALT